MSDIVKKARGLKQVKDLAMSGQSMKAAELYREITGSSLVDADQAVRALQQGRPIMLSGLAGTGMSGQEAVARAQQSFGQPAPRYAAMPAATIQTSTGGARWAGCLVGCFVAILAIGALLAVVFFSAGGLSTFNNLTGLGIPSFTFATQELAFGSEGTGPGLFTDVRAIAINPATGAIFAADYEGGRVQSFDPTGKFIKQWTVGDGTKNTIVTSMAMDHNGNLYLVSEVKVLEYDSNGNLLRTLELPNEAFANSVAVGADGKIIVGCDNDEIVILTSDGTVLNDIKGAFASNGGTVELDVRVAVDGTGNIYALGTFNNAVFKYNPQGKFINRLGSEGDNPGQFTAPDAITVDGQGRVYVSDVKGIQVFDANGRYLDVWDPGGAIFGLATDDQGKIYASSNSQTIFRFAVQKPSTNNQ
jgi:DNA-binding beta-propeller fold protein YncE